MTDWGADTLRVRERLSEALRERSPGEGCNRRDERQDVEGLREMHPEPGGESALSVLVAHQRSQRGGGEHGVAHGDLAHEIVAAAAGHADIAEEHVRSRAL